MLLLPSGVVGQERAVYRLTLGDAARLAAERATSVLEARARTEVAHAGVRQSTAALLPGVGVGVSAGRRTFNTASFGLDFPTPPGQAPLFDPDGEVVGPIESADLRASAVIPLLDLGALGRRRAARATAEATRVAERTASSMAASSAAFAYVSALRARTDVRLREADVQLALELLGVARDLLDAGVGVVIDVTRAEAQVAAMRAQLIAARNSAEITELQLRRRLGLDFDSQLELTDDLETMTHGLPPGEEEAEEAVERALAARSELATAEAYRTAAAQALSATRATRWPTVSARLDDGFYGQRFGNMLGTYTWSLQFSLPVFDGFHRAARAEEQQARLRELDYGVRELVDDIEFEVRRALLEQRAAQEQVVAAEDRERLLELEVEQEEERLRAGVTGTADVVRAATRLNEGRTARLDALAAVQAARIRLAEAMGDVAALP